MRKLSFKKASIAAENCAMLLQHANDLTEYGCAKVYAGFDEMYDLMFRQGAADSIFEEKETLDFVAENVVHYEGPLGRRTLASAHEAIIEICHQVYVSMMFPLRGIEDSEEKATEAKRLIDEKMQTLTLGDVSQLIAHIQRERARAIREIRPDVLVTVADIHQIAENTDPSAPDLKTFKNKLTQKTTPAPDDNRRPQKWYYLRIRPRLLELFPKIEWPTKCPTGT